MKLSTEFPAVIEVVVEIPAGSRNKYEYDEVARVIRLDRVLSSAVYYNFDYGFIEGTRADDGDHTDAMLLIDERTFPGCHVWARPVGVLRMADEKGIDFKVLCVALADPLYRHVDALVAGLASQAPRDRAVLPDLQEPRGQVGGDGRLGRRGRDAGDPAHRPAALAGRAARRGHAAATEAGPA